MLEYLDFDLEIGEGKGRNYSLTVLRSPAGEAQAVFNFPFDKLALERYQDKLQIALLQSGGRHRRALSAENQAAQDYGKALFQALFPEDVRSCYDRSLERAQAQGKGLRIRLHIQPPNLAALPWEYLYDYRQAEYLCLSQNTPVVRYVKITQPISPLAVSPPLRVLGMIASPSEWSSLDVQTEKDRMERALKPLQQRGLASLTWLEGSTWRDLQRILRAGPWHIFHFVGHGGFDPQADEGLLMLTDEQGKAKPISASNLARLLADHSSLRLVVLNACEGATASGLDLFSSTAAILVRRGLPAVVAMQYAITDLAAIELSRAFYEALADGLPVDAALAEARKAISLELENSLEWGIPVLHLRALDGSLFKIQDGAPASKSSTVVEKQEIPQPTVEVKEKPGAAKVAEKPPVDDSAPPRKWVALQPTVETKEQPGAAKVAVKPPLGEPATPRKDKPAMSGKMDALYQSMTDPDLPPTVRLQAANELDQLGWLPEDLYTFVAISGLSYSFHIGKYPVTNIQYQRFLEAVDFAEPQFWRDFPKFNTICKLMGYFQEEGWQWIQENLDEQNKYVPFEWNDPELGFPRRGVPMVGVTWFEANAYCKWLQAHWGELQENRQNPNLQPKLVRLPLETEWIMAAGGAQPPERFPWDMHGEATQDMAEILRRATVLEGPIEQTTPVAMYPLGASPHGIMDMAGNVWEWMGNFNDKNHDTLAMRGGSWVSEGSDARLSPYSLPHFPDDQFSGFGFRVVVFPNSPDHLSGRLGAVRSMR